MDQGLLLRNEYLAAENRILRNQVNGRLLLSNPQKKTLAEIAHRLGHKALADVANAAKPVRGELIIAATIRFFSLPGIIRNPRSSLSIRPCPRHFYSSHAARRRAVRSRRVRSA